MEEVPSLVSQPPLEKQRICLSQLQERHLLPERPNSSHSSQHASPHQSQISHFQTNSPHGHLNSENHAVIFPDSRDKSKQSRMLSRREFAEEFHQSVLQTTRQQELSKSGSQKQHVEEMTAASPSTISTSLSQAAAASRPEYTSAFQHRTTAQTPIHQQSASSMSSSQQSSVLKSSVLSAESTSLQHSPVTPDKRPPSRLYDNSAVFRWPGIEVLMEAYQRHVEEQRLERTMLVENCQRLQQNNQELNRTAEALSLRMGDLLHAKRQLDEERARQQSSVDSLKKCLNVMR